MLAWWGRAVVRLRWWVLAGAAALALVGVVWGTGVFDALVSGGFEDPASESARARARITAELGDHGTDIVVLYSSDTATVDDPAVRGPVVETLAALRQRPEVASVVSWYDTAAPNLISTDRHATYAAVRLRAEEPTARIAAYHRVADGLAAPGVRTEVGGLVPFGDEASEQSIEDITRAETYSMPVLLVLLTVIFGGVVAASTPLLIGGLAILGAFVATRLLTMVTDVSVFAINIITLVGLGMAIDYSLFVVSRFRDELHCGRDVPAAIARTLATAGRTVLVSGLTITLALASLLLFPQVFLRSMGLGGMAAVLVAMLGALTVLPALLAVLGRRIDAGRLPLPRRLRWARAGVAVEDPASGAWARLARSVMRRPVRYVVAVVAILLVLATPSLRMRWSGFDERVMPADSPARIVGERIQTDFPGGTVAPISVLVSGGSAQQAQQLADRIGQLPDVTGARITATGARPGGPAGARSSVIEVSYAGEATGDRAEAAVRAIRALPEPAGAQVLVGGHTANDMDLLSSLGERLPRMALIMAGAILLLLFLAFGSVVLPVKAVLMNLVSIGASFGVIVWIFQDGHLSGLIGFTATGAIEPTNPILMLAVLFGLATDYEVFLLSRVREEWDRTGDNTLSVSTGLQHTGRIITAAAVLLIVVVGGFTTGGITFVKLIGVGMIVAIVVDATLVRALLVPATMRLLGRWNWWAPGPLGRLYARIGIREAPPLAADEAARGQSGADEAARGKSAVGGAARGRAGAGEAASPSDVARAAGPGARPEASGGASPGAGVRSPLEQ